MKIILTALRKLIQPKCQFCKKRNCVIELAEIEYNDTSLTEIHEVHKCKSCGMRFVGKKVNTPTVAEFRKSAEEAYNKLFNP